MSVRNVISSLLASVLLSATVSSAQAIRGLAPPGGANLPSRPGAPAATLSAVIVRGGQPAAEALVRVADSPQFGWTDAGGNITLGHLLPGNHVLLISTPLWSAAVPISLSASSRGHGIVPVATTPSAPPVSPTEGRGHDGSELEGSISALDLAALTVTVATHEHGGVTVSVNDSTLIRHGSDVITLSALTLGLKVHVRATTQPDHSLLAIEINAENEGSGPPSGSFVHGSITAIDLASTSFTLHTENGDIIIVCNASTTLKKNGAAATFTDLAIGDLAGVGGASQSDGSILAATVSAETPEAEDAGAHGMISAIDASTTSFTLHTEHGDIIIVCDSATTFKKDGSAATFADLAVGDAAEAEGTLQTDASILAAKVSAESPEVEEAGAHGLITAIDLSTTSFTLHTEHGDIIIVCDAGTKLRTNDHDATFADLATGDFAEADGMLQTDGSILAVKVSFEPPKPVEVELNGTVDTIDPGTGSFVVQTSVGPLTVVTDSNTEFHDGASFDSLTAGADVEIKGTLQSDGSVLASDISLHTGGDQGGGH